MEELRKSLEQRGIFLDIQSAGALQASMARYAGDDFVSRARMMVLNNLCAKPMTVSIHFDNDTICFKQGLEQNFLKFPYLFDRSLAGARDYILSKMSRLAVWAHSASHSLGTGVLSEGKAALTVNNDWSYTYTLPVCLHCMDIVCILPVALISNRTFLIQGEQKVFVYLCENVAVLFWK
jgi:hypothetical protein